MQFDNAHVATKQHRGYSVMTGSSKRRAGHLRYLPHLVTVHAPLTPLDNLHTGGKKILLCMGHNFKRDSMCAMALSRHTIYKMNWKCNL